MIAADVPARLLGFTARVAFVVAVALASLLAVAAILRMQEYAIGVSAFLVLIGLSVWRPRYGLYALALIIFAFEPGAPYDPVMELGRKLQSNISSWSPLGFVNFAPVELLLIAIMIRVLASAVVERRGLRGAQLQVPLVLFLGLVVPSTVLGLARGGSLNIALWEIRSLFLAGLMAVVVANVLQRREHVHHLVNLAVIAVVLLSIETIWRRLVLLPAGHPLELAFAHESPIFMNFVVILLLARLVWPASGPQRLAAVTIPVILYAQMLTERRAGWIGLDIGLLLLTLFIFRLRRRVFYFVVLPGLVFYVGYLAVFWNAQGALAQPARAVRSINNPEGRDIGSNLARQLEITNLRINIHANPVTGIGFGRKYVDYVGEFNLSWWPFWHYMAHNSVLWVWVKMGVLGFIAFLTLIGAGILRGVQLLKQGTNDSTAPIVAGVVSGLAMLLVYAYVDIALNNLRAMAFLGLILGLIGMWGREAAVRGERAA